MPRVTSNTNGEILKLNRTGGTDLSVMPSSSMIKTPLKKLRPILTGFWQLRTTMVTLEFMTKNFAINLPERTAKCGQKQHFTEDNRFLRIYS